MHALEVNGSNVRSNAILQLDGNDDDDDGEDDRASKKSVQEWPQPWCPSPDSRTVTFSSYSRACAHVRVEMDLLR